MLDLFTRTSRPIDVRASQLDREQGPPAKDVERQVAIDALIAVEEPPLQIAVDRIVGRVEIEDDLLWRLRMRLQKQLDESASIAAGSWLSL